MKNIIALCLRLGVLLPALTPCLGASEPKAAPGSPAKGRVLVLENERTLTGEIEFDGQQYRIKRALGETALPAQGVLRLCASLEEAYLYLKSRANLVDVDERVRLGEWCRQNGLHEQALAEMEAAAKLSPNDARIKRLINYLREVRTRAQAPPAAPAPVEDASVPQLEVSAESLGKFATKVQPILMNACVNCHHSGRGGNFQLTRVTGLGLANRRSLEKNLVATLAQLNLKEPMASKLLTKAITVHASGMAQAPLKNRQTTAFRTLASWVEQTALTHPHLFQVESVPDSTRTVSAANEGKWGEERLSGTNAEDAASSKPSLPSTPMPVPMPSTGLAPAPAAFSATPPPPARTAQPTIEDPVDPEKFNREFHSQQPSPRVEEKAKPEAQKRAPRRQNPK